MELWKDKACKIVWVKNDQVAFDFDGFGISTQTDKNFADATEIKIKYRNRIGTPEFEFKIGSK
jgi:hypothetical protein